MKKILTITAILAIGLAARTQAALVLSDSFTNTLGVATSDLNLDLAARQSGTAAPVSYTVNTNAYPILLTADGKLNMRGDGPSWYGVDADPITDELGSGSFSIKWKAQHDAAATNGNWSMVTVVSDINNNWDISPLAVNLWDHNFIHMDYGTSNNTVAANLLRVDMNEGMISSAIGATYDANDLHEFEIIANASSATRGTWGFSVDGNILAAGLPYTFEDGAKHLQWNATGAADCDWDDLEVSTIPAAPATEYLFFDNFNGPDHVDVNWLYGNRQTNGLIAAHYTGNPQLYNITNNMLLQDRHAAWANLDRDLSSDLEGNDFELSCTLSNATSETAWWTSIYLYDETAPDGRGDSRMGLRITGTLEIWTCFVYYGSGAGQIEAVLDANNVPGLGPFDKTQWHTYKLISTAGTGGTNTLTLVIDGVTIDPVYYNGSPTVLESYFDGSELRLGNVGVNDGSNPSSFAFYYDDIYLKVFKGLTYEDWVVDDTGLTVGVNDDRSADPELDGMDNLLEYALGGDPLVDDTAAILPTADFALDTIEYIYNRRVDHALRGLDYGITLTIDDLQLGTWTNYGAAFESGFAPINTEFEAVTNTLPITGIDMGFLNLEVTEN